MALPDALQGEEWSKVTARKVLPLLVAYANAAEPVTYGKLSEEAVRRKWSHYVMPLAYRYVAGAIGFALEETEKEWGEPIPPINALVVNEATGLPGKGVDLFLRSYLRQTGSNKTLTQAQRQSIVEEIHKDIFNYSGWSRLLKHYGLPSPLKLLTKRKKKPKHTYSWSNEGESQEHKDLKRYILKNPDCVGVPETAIGTAEYLLPSGDKIDVHFEDGDWDIAVVVKSVRSNDDDLKRGIFQCVKYREILRALRRTEGFIPQVRSLLITERELSGGLKEIASTLKVRWVVMNLTNQSSPTR